MNFIQKIFLFFKNLKFKKIIKYSIIIALIICICFYIFNTFQKEKAIQQQNFDMKTLQNIKFEKELVLQENTSKIGVQEEINLPKPIKNAPECDCLEKNACSIPLNPYTNEQVLSLYKAFGNAPCQRELEPFLNLQEKSPLVAEMVNKVYPFCGDTPFLAQDLKQIFLRYKDNALSIIYKTNQNKFKNWMYKQIGALVKVHEIYPNSFTPKSYLDRAHTALWQGDLEKTLENLNQLPKEIQDSMFPFILKAKNFMEAKESILLLLS